MGRGWASSCLVLGDVGGWAAPLPAPLPLCPHAFVRWGPHASWSRQRCRLAVRCPNCSPMSVFLTAGALSGVVVSSCPLSFLLLHGNMVLGFGNNRRHQLVSARLMDDAHHVASWVGSEPTVLVAPMVALVEGRAASHGEGEGGCEGFARVGSRLLVCVPHCSSVVLVLPLCAPLCAPVLPPGVEPTEQPPVSVWGVSF